MVAPEVVVKNIVPTLELGQSRVVLGEWLRDIHGQLGDLFWVRLWPHDWSWIKFLDLKIHFWSLWT